MTWDALAAIATFGATVVALAFGGLGELRAREAEGELAEQRKVQQRDEVEQQARRVTAWISSTKTVSYGAAGSAFDVFVEIQNASTEPVWEVSAEVPFVDWDEDAGDIQGVERITYRVVPPGAVLRRALHRTPPEEAEPVFIEFVDNAGRRWKRSDGQTLVRVAATN